MKRRIYAVSSLSSNPYLTIKDGVLVRCDEAASGEIVIPNGVTSIGDEACSWCNSITSVIIPDSVTSIGDKAFEGCKAITNITIPDSVTSIGYGAFCWCRSITSITIPNSVTSIGDSAFCHCTSLTSLSIPSKNIKIGKDAFKGVPAWDDLSVNYDTDNDDDYDDDYDDDDYDDYDDSELTFEEDYMGDQLGPIFGDACNALGIWCEPSVQGGQGSAYFMTTADDSALGDCDYQDLCSDMQDIWYSNDGDESKVLADIKSWLQKNVLQ